MIRRVSFLNMTPEEWRERRSKTIGGSDAGALLGLNPFKSPYALWAEKTGKAIPEDISDKEAVRLGHDLEEYVAQRFTEATGKKVRRDNNFVYNDKYPFAHVQADRLVVGEDSGLECKTTSSWETLKKCREGEFPDTWYSQCVHAMMVTGAKKWYLAVLCFGHGFFWFEIERDDAEIAALAKAEAEFWGKVKNDIAPPVDGMDSTTGAIKAVFPQSRNGMSVDLTPMMAEIAAWRATKSQIKTLEAQLTEQQNRICTYMGQAESGICGDHKVSWKTQTRRTFDTKRFAADHPHISLEMYYKTTESRPFKLS